MVDFILFFLAIGGGIVSFLTPCNIVTLPSFISFLGSQATTTKKSTLMSLTFSLGFCLMFAIIAVLFIIITGFIRYTLLLKLFSGIVIICLSIYLFFTKQITRKTPFFESFKNSEGIESNSNSYIDDENNEPIDASTLENKTIKYKGYSGSFILGFSLGSAWIGCITPIYLVIVTIASNQEDFIGGLILFFLYALGIMIPYIIIGATIGKLNQRFFVKLIKFGSKLQKIFAIILLYIGIELTLSAFGITGLLPFI